MKFIKNILSDNNQLQRIVVLAMVALILLIASFGFYYYQDRYVRSDDISPINKSISDLEQAVRDDPENLDLRIALAESYLMDENYDLAVAQSLQVLQKDSTKDRAYMVLGVSYASQKNCTEATAPLQKFVEIHQASPMASSDNALETGLYYLGDCQLQLDQPQEAIANLEAALQINRTDADAMYKLGEAYRLTNQHDQAIQSYERAVLFVPNFTEAYQGMLDSYNTQGKNDYAAYARGMVAYSVKDYETAVTELEQLKIVMPDFVPLYLGLGLSYEGLGNLTAAREILQKALELDPENFAAQQALGRVKAAIGQ